MNPVLEVLKTTGISPVSPGRIGVFGQPLRTVQPQPAFTELINNGVLGDIAPTILELMGLEQPKEMTRKSLL